MRGNPRREALASHSGEMETQADNWSPLYLESEWLPISRKFGFFPLAIGVPLIVGAMLLLRDFRWTSTFIFLFLLGWGLVIFGYGLALLMGRSVTILDRENATLTRWRGLRVPFWRKVEPLPPASHVVITCSPEQRGRKTYWCYSIELHRSGFQNVPLYLKRVYAAYWDKIDLKNEERAEIFAGVLALTKVVGSYLSLPVRDDVPAEMSGVGNA